MKPIQKAVLASLLLLLTITSADTTVSAQCAMCKANVETNRQSKTNNVGVGLNTGILYLMAVPYLAGGILFYAWYRKRKAIHNLSEQKPV